MKKLAMIVLMLLLVVGCNNNTDVGEMSSVDQIKEKGKLVVATSADYPPYEFHALIDGKDEIVGFDMEIAKYIAQELGVELEVQDVKFESLLLGLESGMYDMVIAAMSPDPARNVNFSDVYYNAKHGIVINKKLMDEIKTLDDLQGKSVGVQLGSIQEGIAEEMEGITVKPLSLITTLVLELKTDKVDAVLMEKPVAESFAKTNDDIMLVEDIEIVDETGGSAIAMKKGNDELTKEVNQILEKIKAENLIDGWVIEANELSNQQVGE